MKKGLTVYASIMMGISFILLIFFLAGMSGSIVGAVNPELGLSKKSSAMYLTNDAYRRCFKNLEKESEEQVTMHREAAYQAALKDEKRSSVKSLITFFPIVAFTGFVCAFHWSLIKRKDD
jgi:hypothetical protein